MARFLLAFAVAGGHWTQPYFQEGWRDGTPIAVAAVGGFFVLSGFTIRLLTPIGSFSLARYCIERFSRLWSVALPALLVTVALDFRSYSINAPYYLANWGDFAHDPIYRLLANSLFVSQLWGHDIAPLSNSPFWSLSYEAWFYLLFGLYVARKRIWALAAAIVAGPNILFLSTLWLLGVAVFETFDRANSERRLIALCVLSGLITIALLLIFATHTEGLHTSYIAARDAYFAVFRTPVGRTNFLAVMPALVFAPFLLSVLSLAKLVGRLRKPSAVVVRVTRALGDFTFPLYLFHFPLFVFCGAAGFYARDSAAQKIGVFLAVCAAIFVFVPLTTRLKSQLRRALIGALGVVQRKKPPISVQRLR